MFSNKDKFGFSRTNVSSLKARIKLENSENLTVAPISDLLEEKMQIARYEMKNKARHLQRACQHDW